MASRHQNEAVMPHRALLSSEQRIRLFAIPVDPAELARHYVLGTEDRRPSYGQSGARVNRLGLRDPALRSPATTAGPSTSAE